VVQGVMDSTRHIISTTLTTIGGFVPLILDGDSFWLPFAAAMVGGVSGSAVLALILAPSAFVLLARGEEKRARLVAALKRHAKPKGDLIQPAE
jgi:multidrug efflux pump subunit AcrB